MIIKSLTEQNEIGVTDNSIFTVHSKYKQKGKIDKGNNILTVNATLRNKICQQGKLNIGWRRCVAHEFFTVVRCFKCARYGHVAAKCENNVTCFNCGNSHKTSEYSSNSLKCINCVDTNIRLKKSLQTNHAGIDPNCPCYQRIRNLEERKTMQI